MYITWIERLGTLRCQVFPTWSVDSMQSQGKAQQQKYQLFCGYGKIDSTLYERQKTQNSQHNMEEQQSQKIDTARLKDLLTVSM